MLGFLLAEIPIIIYIILLMIYNNGKDNDTDFTVMTKTTTTTTIRTTTTDNDDEFYFDDDNDCDDGDHVIYLVRRFEAAGTEGHQRPTAGHAVITRVSRQLFAQLTIYLVPTLDAIHSCYKPHRINNM